MVKGNLAAAIHVLFISRQRLIGRTNGSSTYLLDLALSVRQAGMIPHLIQPSSSILGRWPLLRLSSVMSVFETHRIRGVWRLGSYVIAADWRIYLQAAWALSSRIARRLGAKGAWAKDRPAPYSISVAWSREDHAFLHQASLGIADVVIADYMFQVDGFESLANPEVPTAIVMHDLFHLWESISPDGRRLVSAALVDRDTECRLLGRADAVVAIQAAEARFVADHVPRTRVVLAPMAADPVDRPHPGDATSVFFVGSNTAPNVVGLKWFFDNVWPSIRAARPATRLSIAGTVAWAFPNGGPDGVRFLGLVDDLDLLYQETGVVISPLTFGSGLKVKLIEAMAHGKAIVATGVTLQGVEAECADAVARADTPTEFAAKVIALLSNDGARGALAASSLAAARQHFARDACYAAFVGWLGEASSGVLKRSKY